MTSVQIKLQSETIDQFTAVQISIFPVHQINISVKIFLKDHYSGKL